MNVNMDFLKLVVVNEEALGPLDPISPNITVILALGLLLGIALGIIAAFIRSLIPMFLAENNVQILPDVPVVVRRAPSQS